MDDRQAPDPVGTGIEQSDAPAAVSDTDGAADAGTGADGDTDAGTGADGDTDAGTGADGDTDAGSGLTDADAGTAYDSGVTPAGHGESMPGGRDPRRFNEWRKRSATGVVMSGIALGLREALELPDQRPALVVEAPGEPGDPDHPIDLRFDPENPAGTVAVVRHRAEGDAPPGDRTS